MANDPLADVGAHLRTARRESGSTLASVAERTGISVSTLSRLESGQRRATLELLLPLTQAYRVTLDDLVGVKHVGDPRVHGDPVTRDGVTTIPLTRRPGGVHAFKLVIRRRPSAELNSHEGYEWLYVLDGRLLVRLGDQEFVLTPGEAAEFDTRVPHAFGSADRRAVEALVLFGPQGERVHLRARPAKRVSRS